MNVIKALRYGFALILFLGSAMPAMAQSPGSEDTSFNIGTLFPGGPTLGFGLQPDGKILVVTSGFSLRRYLANGQLDTSFGNAGTAYGAATPRGYMAATRAFVDPLGRIYALGGYYHHYSSPDSVRNESGIAVARFLANGTVDTSFGTNGVMRHGRYHETNPSSPSSPPITYVEGLPGLTQFSLLPDGRLLGVAASSSSAGALLVARFDGNGQLDASFGGTGSQRVAVGETLNISVVKPDHDGSVLVLGRNTFNNDDVVLKLNAQGTLDTRFGNAGKVRVSDNASVEYSVAHLDVQPDGMIVLGGSRAQPNGNPADSILARLTANGALDRNFGSGGLSVLTLPDRDGIQQLALEPNGKILAVGTTTTTDGTATSRPFLVRVLQNGQIDTSFQQQFLAPQVVPVDLAVSHAAYLLTDPPSNGYELRKFFIDRAPRTDSLTTGQTQSATGFNIDVLNAGGMLVDTATTSHVLGFHGYIYTQPADLGANADVFVVASTARGLYMRTTSGAFVAWSGRISDLVPAYDNMQLTAQTYVPIYGGLLPFTGPYSIYLGYMRDNGPLVYIEEPSAFQVTQ